MCSRDLENWYNKELPRWKYFTTCSQYCLTRIKEYAATLKRSKNLNKNSLSLIRYADDFLIIHEDLNIIRTCQKIIEEWLAQIGLELSQEKTRISHILNEHDQEPGCNFLGFSLNILRKYSTQNCVVVSQLKESL